MQSSKLLIWEEDRTQDEFKAIYQLIPAAGVTLLWREFTLCCLTCSGAEGRRGNSHAIRHSCQLGSRDSQVQYIGCESFPAMLLVLSWEGQATSHQVSKQRESLGRQSEQFGWSENSAFHLDRSLVLINGVTIPWVSFQHCSDADWWRASVPDFFLNLPFHLKSGLPEWKMCVPRLLFRSCAKAWQRCATEMKSGFHMNCKKPTIF